MFFPHPDYERTRFGLFLFVRRKRIREDNRVSAFKNLRMSPIADSFSLLVFDTLQSEGTNNLKSRMYASFAVKRTQKFPAMPVRIKISASK
jgi:hypothetical protein